MISINMIMILQDFHTYPLTDPIPYYWAHQQHLENYITMAFFFVFLAQKYHLKWIQNRMAQAVPWFHPRRESGHGLVSDDE